MKDYDFFVRRTAVKVVLTTPNLPGRDRVPQKIVVDLLTLTCACTSCCSSSAAATASVVSADNHSAATQPRICNNQQQHYMEYSQI